MKQWWILIFLNLPMSLKLSCLAPLALFHLLPERTKVEKLYHSSNKEAIRLRTRTQILQKLSLNLSFDPWPWWYEITMPRCWLTHVRNVGIWSWVLKKQWQYPRMLQDLLAKVSRWNLYEYLYEEDQVLTLQDREWSNHSTLLSQSSQHTQLEYSVRN